MGEDTNVCFYRNELPSAEEMERERCRAVVTVEISIGECCDPAQLAVGGLRKFISDRFNP